ncbi:hypothetical protein PanNE5_32500 [Pandoraea sp. NE5]|nr:hypothetical protein PanNE5_32500 [Pandoraea sp. NE5]
MMDTPDRRADIETITDIANWQHYRFAAKWSSRFMHLQHDCKVGLAESPRHAPRRPKPVHNLHTIGSWRARRRRKPAPPEAKAVTAQRVFGSIRTGYMNLYVAFTLTWHFKGAARNAACTPPDGI